MTCDKCGSIINSGTKCFNCGYDNKNVKMPSKKYLDKVLSSSSYYRSTRLTVFMVLFIIIDIVSIVLALMILTDGNRTEGLKIIAGISMGTAILDMVLCIFILRLKRWAFEFYIVLNIINCIFRLIAYFDFISVIIRALLLYFIFRNDLEYFE